MPCLNLVFVAVQKALRGQGIGNAMMGRAISDFADIGERIGLPLMTLKPINLRVAAFYETLGFTQYGRGHGMYLPLMAAIEVRGPPG